MSNSPSRHAVEKRTKHSQDARKTTLCAPPPIPSDDEEEELPF
jgi:hypothetical protein